MGLFAAIGRVVRTQIAKGKAIAECLSGHDLTEDDVARGTCPVIGCPTPGLFLTGDNR